MTVKNVHELVADFNEISRVVTPDVLRTFLPRVGLDAEDGEALMCLDLVAGLTPLLDDPEVAAMDFGDRNVRYAQLMFFLTLDEKQAVKSGKEIVAQLYPPPWD